jgi:hypothetical protein
MSIKTRITLLGAALLTVAPLSELAGAEEPTQASTADQDYKEKVLAWIDEYATSKCCFATKTCNGCVRI